MRKQGRERGIKEEREGWGRRKRGGGLTSSLALVFTIQIHWCILLACWDLPNVYGVLIAIGGGGDIWWLFYVIELIQTFRTVRQWEIKNVNFRLLASSLTCSLTLVFTIQIHWCILLAYWDLQNVYEVLIAIGGGGDIWWLFYVIELVWVFWTVRRWEIKNFNFRLLPSSLACSLALIFTIQIHWCILLACWDLPNVYGVLIAIGGGGDIWWLFYVIELVRTFWTVQRWKIKNLNFRSLASSLSLPPSLPPSLPRSLSLAPSLARSLAHSPSLTLPRSLAHSPSLPRSLARSLSFSPFKYIGVSYSLAETSQMYMGCWLQLEVVGTSDDYFM